MSRGPIGKDESDGEMVVVSIGAGYTGRKEGRILCVKNQVKRRILHESGREKSPEGRKAQKSTPNLIFYRLEASE